MEINKEDILKEIISIRDILRWTISQFNQSDIYYGHGTDNPVDEALQLVLSSLFLPLNLPSEMYSSRLTLSERSKIFDLVRIRIQQYIPVSYLINKSWFCGLEFYIDERVCIPRSPIGELIRNNFMNLLSCSPRYILDMCTGSGCLAIASAYIYPKAQIDAVDISAEVLEVTKYNIYQHNLENRVIPIQSDLFTNVPKKQRYDLILTNPPYVNQKSLQELPREFYAEPQISLYGGDEDGLNLVDQILYNAVDYLTEDGIMICEVGESRLYMNQRYPQKSFCWINLKDGGDGVFMITRQQLLKYFKIL
ncbi:50S ribosomal protein L3 N(5)-glutamine methyltransferase [Candidatus Schneideria nysicola]|uniref:50S ribosomal protein L3 N(5)-glutamine methyltransferase n=1 Tax=Candidatus Schneideria nysicola TaxID=1081631 RepID=UPI001CAA6F4C|nr:50S ribosomal protein L3 N(5)-glutamine methyltransferase [Candidatus Schneideria nysicola]UAJ65515.1 50S ribosomal protein L3 N(5)-glutamine methyltransferase [Candidatus Schneideria nysicola]